MTAVQNYEAEWAALKLRMATRNMQLEAIDKSFLVNFFPINFKKCYNEVEAEQ